MANPLLFSRAIITDNVTGDKTFGEWKAEQENEFNEVKSPDFPTDGTKFKDNEQYYVVHLSHGLKTVVEEKKVNQTIHYVYKDGSKAVSDFNAIPKLFTRTIIIDKVTGEKTIGK